jgi:hypothetical protein
MSGLKLNFADDSASTSSVGGKPVHSVKRKRQISSSEEEEEEEEVVDTKAKAVDEDAEDELSDESESDKKKSTKVVKTDVSKKTTKTSKKSKHSPGLSDQGRPIYEDYLPDSAEINARLEKILQSFLIKRKEEDDEEEEPAKKAPRTKKSKGKSVAPKKTADQKVLLQISKSFEVLQKKLNKALE